MLNAYRGVFSDRYPVAPEFWYYYPAKVLGVDMIQFQREIPLWKALQTTFKKYQTEGWGIAWATSENSRVSSKSSFEKTSDTQYRERVVTRLGGREFTSSTIFDIHEPSWVVEYPVKNEEDIAIHLDAALNPDITLDYTQAHQALDTVGEDYLLEFCLGGQFFDTVAGMMGCEKALYYFMSEDPAILERYQKRYIEFQRELTRRVCRETRFQSFFIGCCYSCPSLIGPNLWRKWDKPYIQAVAEEVHRQGKLVHLHFHGLCKETLADLAELGVDCICPFERPPGGDINGLDDLRKVRTMLGNTVTMNGNVHTVETLIRGTPEKVRSEVREIKLAYAGCPRLIIGTGDQVGKETPEENILAMIDEAKKTI